MHVKPLTPEETRVANRVALVRHGGIKTRTEKERGAKIA